MYISYGDEGVGYSFAHCIRSLEDRNQLFPYRSQLGMNVDIIQITVALVTLACVGAGLFFIYLGSTADWGSDQDQRRVFSLELGQLHIKITNYGAGIVTLCIALAILAGYLILGSPYKDQMEEAQERVAKLKTLEDTYYVEGTIERSDTAKLNGVKLYARYPPAHIHFDRGEKVKHFDITVDKNENGELPRIHVEKRGYTSDTPFNLGGGAVTITESSPNNEADYTIALKDTLELYPAN